MIEAFIIIIVLVAVIMTYSLCVAAKRGDQQPEECSYNILEGCKGKCCRECEIESLCKMACEEDPKQCGGRIKK